MERKNKGFIITMLIGGISILAGILVFVVMCSTTPNFKAIKNNKIVEKLPTYTDDSEHSYENLNRDKFYIFDEEFIETSNVANKEIGLLDIGSYMINDNSELKFSSYMFDIGFVFDCEIENEEEESIHKIDVTITLDGEKNTGPISALTTYYLQDNRYKENASISFSVNELANFKQVKISKFFVLFYGLE